MPFWYTFYVFTCFFEKQMINNRVIIKPFAWFLKHPLIITWFYSTLCSINYTAFTSMWYLLKRHLHEDGKDLSSYLPGTCPLIKQWLLLSWKGPWHIISEAMMFILVVSVQFLCCFCWISAVDIGFSNVRIIGGITNAKSSMVLLN